MQSELCSWNPTSCPSNICSCQRCPKNALMSEINFVYAYFFKECPTFLMNFDTHYLKFSQQFLPTRLKNSGASFLLADFYEPQLTKKTRGGTSLGSGSKAWISALHKVRHRLGRARAQADEKLDKLFSGLEGRLKAKKSGKTCFSLFKPVYS